MKIKTKINTTAPAKPVSTSKSRAGSLLQRVLDDMPAQKKKAKTIREDNVDVVGEMRGSSTGERSSITTDATRPESRPASRTTLRDDETRAGGTAIGHCLSVNHPTLNGRVQVSWEATNHRQETMWLACLKGVTCRPQDRVLLSHPSNYEEPVVIGVLDGFSRRPPPQEIGGPSLALQRDEALTITNPEGEALFKVSQDDDGAVIQLLNPNCHLRVAGKLQVTAKQLELKAEEGRAEISASEDVVLQGEHVRLN